MSGKRSVIWRNVRDEILGGWRDVREVVDVARSTFLARCSHVGEDLVLGVESESHYRVYQVQAFAF